MMSLVPITPPRQCWLAILGEEIEGPYDVVAHAIDDSDGFEYFDGKTYWLVILDLSSDERSTRWLPNDEVYFTEEAAKAALEQ